MTTRTLRFNPPYGAMPFRVRRSVKLGTMFVTAIIAAGGRGTRFGGGRPKQLLLVGGRPILERSVTAFLDHPLVHEVVVSMPDELAGDPPGYLRQSLKPLQVVAGGPR